MPRDRLDEPAIELGRGYPPVPDVIGAKYRVHQAVEPDAGACRERYQRNARDLRQPLVQLRAQMPETPLLVHNEVPLVDADDEGAPFLDDLRGDRQILMLEGVLRIDQQHDDLSEAHGTYRVAGGELFRQFGDARLATQSCRVKQPDRSAVPKPIDGDGISRQAGFRACDHALFSEQ